MLNTKSPLSHRLLTRSSYHKLLEHNSTSRTNIVKWTMILLSFILASLRLTQRSSLSNSFCFSFRYQQTFRWIYVRQRDIDVFTFFLPRKSIIQSQPFGPRRVDQKKRTAQWDRRFTRRTERLDMFNRINDYYSNFYYTN